MNNSTFSQLFNPNNGPQAISPAQLKTYINHLNTICQNNAVSLVFNADDFVQFLSINNGKKVWHITDAGRNKINQWLFNFFPDLKQKTTVHLYRFLPYARFYGLFNTQSLRMSSMAVNRKFNGPGEYEDYFKAISLNYDKESIDNTAAKTYLMCFISDWKKKYMWENYVKHYEGFCIEVDISPKDPNNLFWNFREVSYQAPAVYKWISDSINSFKSNYDIDICFPWSKFAYIYKGPKFSREIETRIYIHEETEDPWRSDYMNAVGNNYPTKSYMDNGETFFYLDMPLKNSLFEIDINKVYLGKRISDTELKKMESVLNSAKIPYEEICIDDARLQ